MGFGAERANLMGESPVDMRSTAGNTLNSPNDEEENKELSKRTNNAKTNLIKEIKAFNSERMQNEAANEDHKDESYQMAAKFTEKASITSVPSFLSLLPP